MLELQIEKERTKELLIKQKQLINATSCLYEMLGILAKLTKGMRHLACYHPTMKSHSEIMHDLRLAEDLEEELGKILSQGNFGRDEIEAELDKDKDKDKNENKKPNFLYLKNDVIDAIAYAIYHTANPDSKMCVPNCAYIQADKMFEKWKEEK